MSIIGPHENRGMTSSSVIYDDDMIENLERTLSEITNFRDEKQDATDFNKKQIHESLRMCEPNENVHFVAEDTILENEKQRDQVNIKRFTRYNCDLKSLLHVQTAFLEPINLITSNKLNE